MPLTNPNVQITQFNKLFYSLLDDAEFILKTEGQIYDYTTS